jgi:hypothetical protein
MRGSFDCFGKLVSASWFRQAQPPQLPAFDCFGKLNSQLNQRE